jgi:hypothetical protein
VDISAPSAFDFRAPESFRPIILVMALQLGQEPVVPATRMYTPNSVSRMITPRFLLKIPCVGSAIIRIDYAEIPGYATFSVKKSMVASSRMSDIYK